MCMLLGLSHQVPLLTWRVFKEARIKFFDKYDKLIPCYDIEPVENTTDTVSLFVWYSIFTLLWLVSSTLTNSCSLRPITPCALQTLNLPFFCTRLVLVPTCTQGNLTLSFHSGAKVSTILSCVGEDYSPFTIIHQAASPHVIFLTESQYVQSPHWSHWTRGNWFVRVRAITRHKRTDWNRKAPMALPSPFVKCSWVHHSMTFAAVVHLQRLPPPSPLPSSSCGEHCTFSINLPDWPLPRSLWRALPPARHRVWGRPVRRTWSRLQVSCTGNGPLERQCRPPCLLLHISTTTR